MLVNNIHCLALNYQGVGDTSQLPIYFLKSTSCLLRAGETVPFPKFLVSNVWTEVELGIYIEQVCENISEEDAKHVIGGFFVAGDITCNNLYGRDHHLAASKARTGFAPIGSIVSPFDISNGLYMRTYVDGKCTQEGNTNSMILNPYKAINYISQMVKLLPGDIILTGTPAGAENNIVTPGSVIKHVIENVGELNYIFGE